MFIYNPAVVVIFYFYFLHISYLLFTLLLCSSWLFSATVYAVRINFILALSVGALHPFNLEQLGARAFP